METQKKLRIHPLAAGAAVAVIYCGVVESVNAYKQKGKGSLVGKVGGGVVGALVGSQGSRCREPGTSSTIA